MPAACGRFPSKTILLVVLATVLSACGSSNNSAAPSPASENFKYGEDIIFEPASPPPTPGGTAPDASKGELILTLRDQNDRGPEGIPVLVTGDLETQLWSNKEGLLRFEALPGNYQFEIVAGCTDRLIVEAGRRGHATIFGNSAVSGKLSVKWKHRIAPAIGAYPSKYPDWYIGESIEVYYDVLDRCRYDKAPGGGYPAWAFRTSDNLEIVGTPRLVADEKAQGLVNVRCTRAGEASLVAFDSKNPPDEFDLIRYMIVMAGSKTQCVPRS